MAESSPLPCGVEKCRYVFAPAASAAGWVHPCVVYNYCPYRAIEEWQRGDAVAFRADSEFTRRYASHLLCTGRLDLC
jgi:hypothetical protein